MPEKERFMDAVAAKVGAKRRPMMKRKGLTGSAPAVVIAIGAPKKPMLGKKADEMEDDAQGEDMKLSKADKIAALQEKIASLKAELALLEDEEEMDEVEEDAYEEDEARDEDED